MKNELTQLNDQTFKQHFYQWFFMALRFARKFGLDRETCEDIAQDTLTRVLLYKETVNRRLEEGRDFDSYFKTMIKGVIIDFFKKRAKQRLVETNYKDDILDVIGKSEQFDVIKWAENSELINWCTTKFDTKIRFLKVVCNLLERPFMNDDDRAASLNLKPQVYTVYRSLALKWLEQFDSSDLEDQIKVKQEPLI